MGALSSLATLGLNLALSRQAQRAEDKQQRSAAAQQIERIRLDSAGDRQRAEAELRRRIAAERARAGAAGVALTGGSADAVIRGLEEESRAEEAARAAEDEARVAAIRDSLGQRRRRNLLDFTSRWLNAGTRSLTGTRAGGRSLLD
jgi:hypothetical protein